MSRKKEEPTHQDELVAETKPEESGKGRPTPKRKEAEAVHKRPLVGTASAAQNMTKEQRKEQRRKARENYDRGMQTGEERYLPARDKGPVKRYVRNYIDSRRSIGEYFLMIAIVMLVAVFALSTAAPQTATIGLLGMYLVVFFVIGDGIVRGRKLKKALVAKFGADGVPKGTVWYGIMRSMQIRRSRMPAPQVARGEYPQ
jgi:hypothetical protein